LLLGEKEKASEMDGLPKYDQKCAEIGVKTKQTNESCFLTGVTVESLS
jgi:hypothetical protein